MLLNRKREGKHVFALSDSVKAFCSILVMTSICLAHNQSKALSNSEMESVLILIGRQIRGNQEAIRTWKGSLKVVDYNYWYGNQLKKHSVSYDKGAMMEKAKRARRRVTSTVEFAVDAVHDKLFTTWDSDRRVELIDSGTQLPPKLRRSKARYIVTPEEYLHYEPEYNYGQFDLPITDGIVIGKAAFRDPPQKAAGRYWGEIRDPRVLFKYDEQTVYGLFEEAADNLNEAGNILIHGLPFAELISLEVNGHTEYHFTSRYSGKSDEYISIVAVAGSDVNYNVKSITTYRHYTLGSDTKEIEKARLEWMYERMGDIFVPKKMHFLLNNSNGSPSFDSTVELVKSELNKPIPDKVFTWRNLKLDDGARFIDNIRQLEFTYHDGELIPASFAHLAKEASTELLESMIDEMDDEVVENPSYDIFLPRIALARKYGKPYILDFQSGKLLFMDIDLDTDAAHDFLAEKRTGHIAWNGSFVTVRKAEVLTPRHESHRPLTMNADKSRWIRRYKLPESVEMPYSIIVKTDEAGYYLMKVCAIESDGIKVIYRKLGPDEIESYRAKPQLETNRRTRFD